MSLRPRVLLVEDDELVSATLREILDEDYEVSCVVTAQQALAEIAGHRIDVVLLDYRLPDGNGQRVAESSTEASTPVIWMTGDPEAVRGGLYGSHLLLAKPFGVSVLRRTLADALTSR